MSCKYNNSLYTSNPPKTLVADLRSEEDYLNDAIDEHNFEESYEQEQMKLTDAMEHWELMELIKHEPKQEFV